MIGSELPPLSAELRELVAKVLTETSEHDLPAIVEGAAQAVAAATKAKAVSLLCTSGSIVGARAGDWPEAARPRLDAWERALVKRVRQNLQSLPEGPLPLSVAKVPGWVVCNVPLASGNRVVGTLSVCTDGPQEEIASTVKNLSPWLGAVLRLVQDLEVANRRLGGLGMIFHAGAADLDVEDSEAPLENTLRLASRLVNAQACLVLTVPEAQAGLYVRAAYTPGEPLEWAGAQLKAGGLLGHAVQMGETVRTNDPATDAKFSPEVEGALLASLDSLLAVPLQKQGTTFGALVALNRRDGLGFSQSDAWLLEGVAAHVAVSLENARLFHSLRDEHIHLANVQRAIRADIANNLHQGAIQMLAAVTMELDHLAQLAVAKPEALPQEVDSLKELTREATREARLLLFELRPTILETDGLVPALQDYIRQLPNEGETVHLDFPDTLPEMGYLAKQTAFSLAVQGIRHSRQHGKSKEIWLTLRQDGQSFVVDIEDDGLPQSKRRCTSHGQDLRCDAFMQEQAALARGTVEVRDGDKDERPRIRVKLPLRRS